MKIHIFDKIECLYDVVSLSRSSLSDDFDIFPLEKINPRRHGRFLADKREFYMIFLFSSQEEGSFYFNNRPETKFSNALIFLGPDQIFQGIRGHKLTGYGAAFHPSFLNLQRTDFNLNNPYFLPGNKNIIPLGLKDKEQLIRIFQCLYMEKEHRESSRYLMQSVLSKCRSFYRKINESVTKKDRRFLHTFIQLIKDNRHREHSVDFYARTMGFSANHLNNKVKSLSGISAKETITQLILSEAMEQLTHNSISILKLAENLGFKDPSYFGRFFKQHTGISPGNYKKRFNPDYK